MKCSFVAVMLLLAGSAFGQDPVKTDSDKYKVVKENERVRVLRYHDHPGDKTTMHVHPDLVLYAIAPFRRRLTFPDGKTRELEFKAGDVVLLPGQKHVGENIGSTDTEVLIVELKEPALASPKTGSPEASKPSH